MSPRKVFKVLTLVLTLFVVLSGNVFSQIEEPVKFKFKTEKLDDTHYNLIFEATIEDGWHLYSHYMELG